MSKDQDFIEKGSKLVNASVNSLELSLLNTPSGNKLILKLTPKTIKRMAKLTFFIPRAIIVIDFNKGLKILNSHHATLFGKTTTLHLYEGGLKFPVNKSTDESHAILEYTISRQNLHRQELVQKPGESNRDWKERDARIREAFGHDRYWFAVPSSLVDSIHFPEIHHPPDSILISDREYARRFAEFNNLEGGVWQGVVHRIKLALAIGLAVLIWIPGWQAIVSILDLIPDSFLISFIVLMVGPALLILIDILLIKFIPKKNIEPL